MEIIKQSNSLTSQSTEWKETKPELNLSNSGPISSGLLPASLLSMDLLHVQMLETATTKTSHHTVSKLGEKLGFENVHIWM